MSNCVCVWRTEKSAGLAGLGGLCVYMRVLSWTRAGAVSLC